MLQVIPLNNEIFLHGQGLIHWKKLSRSVYIALHNRRIFFFNAEPILCIYTESNPSYDVPQNGANTPIQPVSGKTSELPELRITTPAKWPLQSLRR